MSTPEDLLNLLDEEATILRTRQFEKLESISQRISNSLQTLQLPEDSKDLELIRMRAYENARLLSIMHAAVGGLKQRLSNLGVRESFIGYYRDGRRITCDEKNKSSRL